MQQKSLQYTSSPRSFHITIHDFSGNLKKDVPTGEMGPADEYVAALRLVSVTMVKCGVASCGSDMPECERLVAGPGTTSVTVGRRTSLVSFHLRNHI